MTFRPASLRLLLRLMAGILQPYSLEIINKGNGIVKRDIPILRLPIKEQVVVMGVQSALTGSYWSDTTI